MVFKVPIHYEKLNSTFDGQSKFCADQVFEWLATGKLKESADS